MQIFYRMSPNLGHNEDARPCFKNNKLKLTHLCLDSFNKAFKEIDPEITFILDGGDDAWLKMIDDVCRFDFKIVRTNLGQSLSYLKQLEMAIELNDDEVVLFQEDDYFYLPNPTIGNKIQEAVVHLGFVNPYDHGEFYRVRDLHPLGGYDIELAGNHHWRTCKFNTMTWAARVKDIKECWGILNIHGFWDKPTWEAMALEAKKKLWCPIPTLATHMDVNNLSPTINWRAHFNVEK